MYTETRDHSGRRGNLEFAATAADGGAEHCNIGFRNGPHRIPSGRTGVGIILVGRVTAEINYVRDEIPGPRGVTIENGSSPTQPRESTTVAEIVGLSLLASCVLPARATFRLCHSEIKLAGSPTVRNSRQTLGFDGVAMG